jgi:hypothetical protein
VTSAVSVPVAGVTAAAGEGSNAQPECRFSARLTSSQRVKVVANVDSAPQAYFRLERTIVEAGQQFGAVRTFAAPVHVPHLGLDASWFPDQDQLMTTDGHRLITVTVSWRAVKARRRISLAAAVARRYLGKLDPKAAEPAGS